MAEERPRARRGFRETVLLLRIYAFVVLVPILLRVRLGRLSSLLEPTHVPPVPDEARANAIVDATDRVLRSGRPFVRTGCLTRGLTLLYFLRRAGLDVSLEFGVGEVEGEPTGHCWLVKDGEPFLEKEDPRPMFTEVCRLTSGTAIAVG
jgi:hypothetical protein